MKQTPLHSLVNPDLMAMIPETTRCIVDVGCMQGMLAKEWRASHPQCKVVGVDIDPHYAQLAERYCDRALCADVDGMDDATFATLFPSDCWVFGDCLEHLRDPWRVLQRIRAQIDPDGCVLVSMPNAQHWSMQWRLVTGNLRYEDQGLMDRTHLRFFTRTTMLDMFRQAGFVPDVSSARVITNEFTETALQAIEAAATALGVPAAAARADAEAFQLMFRLRVAA